MLTPVSQTAKESPKAASNSHIAEADHHEYGISSAREHDEEEHVLNIAMSHIWDKSCVIIFNRRKPRLASTQGKTICLTPPSSIPSLRC